MADRRSGIARALGGPAARRRRHWRIGTLLVALAVVAGYLILVAGDEGDSSFADAAAATCGEYSERLQREFALSFPEGVPTEAAEEEYLSRAFVDTLDELVAELLDLGPTGDAADAVDLLARTSAALREDPSLGIDVDPFAAEVRPAFDEVGIEACGSGFLGAPE